jgi:hypothetical protein
VTALLEVGLDDGGSVLFEIDGHEGAPALRGTRSSGMALVEAGKDLDSVLGDLGSVTQAMMRRLRSLADSPHEIEVEFSVKLTAEAKLVVARAGGEANFRIAMRWSPDAGGAS